MSMRKIVVRLGLIIVLGIAAGLMYASVHPVECIDANGVVFSFSTGVTWLGECGEDNDRGAVRIMHLQPLYNPNGYAGVMAVSYEADVPEIQDDLVQRLDERDAASKGYYGPTMVSESHRQASDPKAGVHEGCAAAIYIDGRHLREPKIYQVNIAITDIPCAEWLLGSVTWDAPTFWYISGQYNGLEFEITIPK